MPNRFISCPRRAGTTALAFLLLAALPVTVLPATAAVAKDQAAETQTGPSGLPLPRFVSLKASRINVRVGPGRDYEVAFTFVKPGLPVEIVQEYDNWRKVRDQSGEEGWIFHSLLSGRRTAVVAPWQEKALFDIRANPTDTAPVTAKLRSNVVVEIAECDKGWCRIRGEGYEGWIAQERLWGVYPDEVVGR